MLLKFGNDTSVYYVFVFRDSTKLYYNEILASTWRIDLYTVVINGYYNEVHIYTSITMKPYIKGQYYMITTIPLCDNYFLVVII